MEDAPRSRGQRLDDTRDRLSHDVDAWFATAGTDGPHLVPLSFLWHDEAMLIATDDASPTARNLHDSGQVRVAVGPTRDVVLVEAEATALDGVDDVTGDAFAEHTGFDPRQLDNYTFYRVVPRELRAWREVTELEHRLLMREGRWLEP
jgi:hypothetical protein